MLLLWLQCQQMVHVGSWHLFSWRRISRMTDLRKLFILLQEFNPQSLSNVLWAFASLKHHPGNALLDASAAHAVRCVDQFTPQVCLHNGDCFLLFLINNMSVALHSNRTSSRVVICCHKSCCICDLMTLEACQRHLQLRIVACTSICLGQSEIVPNERLGVQALTLTMIAYATFAHSPPESLLTAVSEHAVVSLSKFEQQAIANLIWALALLHALSPQMWNQLLEAFSSVDDLQGNPDAVIVSAL